MILKLTNLSRRQYHKKVIEYFDAWGIPADGSGRTDDGRLSCSTGNPGFKGIDKIPDNKITSRTTKRVKGKHKARFCVILHKNAKQGIFSFEMFLPNTGKLIWGSAKFIDNKRIDIHIVNDWILDALAQNWYPSKYAVFWSIISASFFLKSGTHVCEEMYKTKEKWFFYCYLSPFLYIHSA